MKSVRKVVTRIGCIAVLVSAVSLIESGFFSADWWDKNVAQPIQKEVIKPVEVNVVKPVAGIGATIVNIFDMAVLIKNKIQPIEQVIAQISTQINLIGQIQNGKDLVDPIFAMLNQLTSLPPHFQAVLNKIVASMEPLENIVRPANPAGAQKIKDARVEIASISQAVDDITKKIERLNKMLHTRVKVIAENASEATQQVMDIIK